MKRIVLSVLIMIMAMSTGGCYLAIGGWGHDHDSGGYHDRYDDRYHDRGGYHEGGYGRGYGQGRD